MKTFLARDHVAMSQGSEHGAEGLYYRKLPEENFPFEKLQAMIR